MLFEELAFPSLGTDVVEMFWEGHREPVAEEVSSWLLGAAETDMLALLVYSLMEQGRAHSVHEALSLLLYEGSKALARPVRVYKSDLQGRQPFYSPLVRDLQSYFGIAGPARKAHDTLFRVLGVRTHFVLGHVLRRALPIERTVSSQMRFCFAPKGQLLLFEECHAGAVGPQISRGGRIEQSYVSAMHAVAREARRAMKPHKSWCDRYTAGVHFIPQLTRYLAPLVGEKNLWVRRHEETPKSWYEYLHLLTFLTWVRYIVYAQRRPRPGVMFVEVPVFGCMGGLADIVEVISIKGHKPTARDRRVLERIHDVHHNTPALLPQVVQWAGGDVVLRVRDFKACVGDGTPKQQLLDQRAIKAKPVAGHVRQIALYDTLIRAVAASRSSSGNALQFPSDVWASGITEPSELIYLFPERVVTHPVSVSPKQASDLFERMIRGKYAAAQRTASFARLTSIFCSLAKPLLDQAA